MGSPEGIWRVSTIRWVGGRKRWDAEGLSGITGLPWSWNPEAEIQPSDLGVRVLTEEEKESGRKMVFEGGKKIYRMQRRRGDFLQHGSNALAAGLRRGRRRITRNSRGRSRRPRRARLSEGRERKGGYEERRCRARRCAAAEEQGSVWCRVLCCVGAPWYCRLQCRATQCPSVRKCSDSGGIGPQEMIPTHPSDCATVGSWGRDPKSGVKQLHARTDGRGTMVPTNTSSPNAVPPSSDYHALRCVGRPHAMQGGSIRRWFGRRLGLIPPLTKKKCTCRK